MVRKTIEETLINENYVPATEEQINTMVDSSKGMINDVVVYLRNKYSNWGWNAGVDVAVEYAIIECNLRQTLFPSLHGVFFAFFLVSYRKTISL